MRNICVLLGIFAILVVGVDPATAQPPAAGTTTAVGAGACRCGATASSCSHTQTAGCGTGCSDCGCGDCGNCGQGCGGCGFGLGGGIGGKWAGVIAAEGYFNCRCRGSYKFPVPPQYTYHWPGMYSQRTTTEYNSPFRFPPLRLPEEAFPEESPEEERSTVQWSGQGEDQLSDGTISLAEPKETANLEPVSGKIKRLYGLE